jgi:hypothetical protein
MAVAGSKRRGAGRKGPETPAPTTTTAKVALETDDTIDPVYANYAEVARSQFEVEINFARLPAKPSASQREAIQSGEPLIIFPSVRVILPLAVAQGLIKALTQQAEVKIAGENDAAED